MNNDQQSKPSVQPVISNNDSDSSEDTASSESVRGLDESDDDSANDHVDIGGLALEFQEETQESAGSVHGLDSSDDETTHNYNELKDLMITEEVLCTWLLEKWDLQH